MSTILCKWKLESNAVVCNGVGGCLQKEASGQPQIYKQVNKRVEE